MSEIIDALPEQYRRLLDLPLYGHLGTIRTDGGVQVNPMWFEFDGEHVRFTHTSTRAKWRNLQANPAMSYSIIDPEQPFHYLEVAGSLVDAIPDPTGAFYVRLQQRYGIDSDVAPRDAADRVILVMSIDRTTKQ